MKLVIFDCDGTLVSSEYSNNRAIARAAKKLGIEGYETEDCIQKFRGCNLEMIVKKIISETGIFVDENSFLQAIKIMSLSLSDDVKSVDNAHFVLEKLKINKAVASNGDRECVIKYLKNNNLFEFFGEEKIFTQDQVANPKPAPDIFLHAADYFKVNPQECLVIEDSEMGVIAAKKAGMNIVGYIGTAFIKERRKSKLIESGADHIINDLKEIYDLYDFI